jgi:hypothetical protein
MNTKKLLSIALVAMLLCPAMKATVTPGEVIKGTVKVGLGVGSLAVAGILGYMSLVNLKSTINIPLYAQKNNITTGVAQAVWFYLRRTASFGVPSFGCLCLGAYLIDDGLETLHIIKKKTL